MAQGIGAQDNDMIEMHNEAGRFVTTAGYVWSECLFESAVMRREAYKLSLDFANRGTRPGADLIERASGIPASWPKS